MVGRRGRSGTIVSTLAASLAACADNPSPVAIGLPSDLGEPSSANLARSALDTSQPPGQPHIVFTGGAPPARARSPDDTSLTEVDRAIRLASDPTVVAVVGPSGSREALETASIYRDAAVPNLIPTSTSSRLRSLGPPFFLLAPDDSVQGDFIGRFVADYLRPRRVAIVYLPDQYGVGLATGTEVALRRRGIELTVRMPVRPMRECPPHIPSNAYDDVVIDVLGYGAPDVVVLATRTRETACIARAVNERLAATRFVAGDGALVDHAFVGLAGPAADSIYLVRFWHQSRADSVSRNFAEGFRARVGREPRHDDAMYYDAIMLAGKAIRDGGPSRHGVTRYLKELGRSRPPFHGVTGPIAFTPNAPRPLLMTRMVNGRPEALPGR